MRATNREKGVAGELLASKYLIQQGYQIKQRNWRCRYGEIDLIAYDPAARSLVFCEVKARYSNRYGGAIQAIDTYKYRRLRQLVGYWLNSELKGRQLNCGIRIDAVLIDYPSSGKSPRLHHLRGV